jgi:hypothetical protein
MSIAYTSFAIWSLIGAMWAWDAQPPTNKLGITFAGLLGTFVICIVAAITSR